MSASKSPVDAVDTPSSKSGDAAAGYQQPPAKTRFPKGRSGNPQGRPKGRPNIAHLIKEILNESVPVREGDKSRKMPTCEAIIRVLVMKAGQGDAQAGAESGLDVDVGSVVGDGELEKLLEVHRPFSRKRNVCGGRSIPWRAGRAVEMNAKTPRRQDDEENRSSWRLGVLAFSVPSFLFHDHDHERIGFSRETTLAGCCFKLGRGKINGVRRRIQPERPRAAGPDYL